MNEIYSSLVLHLIESTDWAIIFLGIVFLLRIKDSRVKCWLYRLSLLKFLIPTALIASWFTFSESAGTLTGFTVIADEVKSVVSYTTEQPLFTYPIFLWLAGLTTLLIIGWITGLRLHKSIHRNHTPFTGRNETLLEQSLQSVDRSTHALKGYLIEKGPSIALYGIFRPRIIAKRAFLDTLEDDEIASAFQHEVTHWIRRDNFCRLFTDAITAVFWFHPLVWFIRKRLTLETEKACDETVLSSGKKADRYASCLLKAAEFSHEESQFGSIALSETSLKKRVSHVIHYKKEKVSIMKKSAIILTCLILFEWSFLAFAETAPSNENRAFDISELDKAPIPVHQEFPVYPPELKKERIEGRVNILFIVNEQGNVISPEIENSSNAGFNESAINGVLRWKFEPGLIDGEPVRTRVRLPMLYRLKEPHKGKE